MSRAQYYAVKIGRKPGLYNTWDDCKLQTEGFSGAIYKKFPTKKEALQFLGLDSPSTAQPKEGDVPKLKRKKSTTTEPSKKLKLDTTEKVAPVDSEMVDVDLPPLKRNHIEYLKTQIPSISSEMISELLSVEKSLVEDYLSKVPISCEEPKKKRKRKSLLIEPDIQSLQTTPDEVVVWTDGACQANGTGSAIAGIGVWFGEDDPRNISAKVEGKQTNNRAEMTAVIRGLQTIKKDNPGAPVQVRSDSSYVINGITSWIHSWKKKGWKTAKLDDVENQDLWLLLDQEVQGMKIKWVHVRGHSGEYGNEKADQLAVAGCIK